MRARKKISRSQFLKVALSAVCVLLGGLLLLSCDSTPKTDQPAPNKKQAADLTTHPVYAAYQFGADDKTIDFGTQPLAVPTGTLAEVIQRDKVLGSLLAEAGYTLKFHSFYKGSDINFFMKRGDLDLAVGGDMPALIAAAQDFGVATALVKQNYSAIITDKITKLEELKGKRVGYAPGSTAHYALMAALKTVDLSDKDLSLVRLNVNEMTGSLAQGKIDAFAAWEPTPTIALKTSPNFRVLHRGLSSSYLYCTQRFFQQKPEIVKLLLASLIRSMRWMTLSTDNLLLASDWSLKAAQRFSGNQNGLTREEYARLIEDGIVKIASSPIIPMSVLREEGQLHNESLFLQQAGKIAPDVAWQPILKNFDRRLMTEVLNNPVQFRLKEYIFEK
jgi:NitT/TauT family transport system substrate-binding protein